jgi:hypothetical protein
MKKNRTNKTEKYLQTFTLREEDLLRKARELNRAIPFRLIHWREWIGDSQIYLNELKNLVER